MRDDMETLLSCGVPNLDLKGLVLDGEFSSGEVHSCGADQICVEPVLRPSSHQRRLPDSNVSEHEEFDLPKLGCCLPPLSRRQGLGGALLPTVRIKGSRSALAATGPPQPRLFLGVLQPLCQGLLLPVFEPPGTSLIASRRRCSRVWRWWLHEGWRLGLEPHLVKTVEERRLLLLSINTIEGSCAGSPPSELLRVVFIIIPLLL
mmetsp:Transcript_29023/g.84752  ORF Transcript_29023/g.84752 Transcript_29023/m.84752 type:complete len:204 (-) Transcript_29023:324-935(-)